MKKSQEVQMRILRARLRKLGAEFGKTLLPYTEGAKKR